MTCIVLTRNPDSGNVLALTDGDGDIKTWTTAQAATEATFDHSLIEAWTGWVVDLDNLEIKEV